MGDLCPNPHLLGFWNAHPLPATGKSALVVGCALGDDAEQLASWGFQTTAFDISETAIRTARKRYPNSKVDYVAADLFAAPASWQRKFDFALEAYTLQALPAAIRPRAMEKMAEFLRAGAFLLAIALGRQPSDPEGELPWPLTRNELSTFTAVGLEELSFEELHDPDDHAVRRFRVLYRLPSSKIS